MSEDGIDAVKEGALLKRVQREEIQIKLDKERRNLLCSEEVAAVIGSALATTKTKWLAFPSWLRSIMPQITPRESVQIEDKIREILSELSYERLPTHLRRITEQYLSDLHAAAEANGDGVGGPVPDVERGKQRGAG